MALDWTLHTEVLQQTATELWLWVEMLVLEGVGFDDGCLVLGGLDWIVWPPGLRRLFFYARTLDTPVQSMPWPIALQKLEFGERFNEPIVGVAWPDSVQRLHFGECFNQPIAGVAWPSCLEGLVFAGEFDKPIAAVDWPPKLKELRFGPVKSGPGFDQPIAQVVWPNLVGTAAVLR